VRSRAAAAVVVIVTALVLAADLTVLVARRPRPAGTQPAVTDLDRLLPELMAFVEQARGLRFKQAPKVELLPDQAFEARLLEGDEDEESLAGDEAHLGFLRALGLVEGGVDLEEVETELAADIVGFYDSEAQVLSVRGVALTPYAQVVLVHELTHALDDQHFGLDRDDLLDEDESAAFAALVEGSALVVEQRWFDSRPPAEQSEIEREEGSGGDEGPGELEVFARLLSFPYQEGPRFVEEVLEAGQQAGLDEAFRNPPVTSEHVLHPERFLTGEQPRLVAAPDPDGPEIERGTLGELGLVLVLDGAVEHSTALRAAAGWGGDRYVAWSDGARTCVRWNVVMDTGRDTDEVAAALRRWVARNQGASVRGSDPVVVTSCG
jgi:hypothetical protein